jgi:tetratricopeptide (TPR) repeat protein
MCQGVCENPTQIFETIRDISFRKHAWTNSAEQISGRQLQKLRACSSKTPDWTRDPDRPKINRCHMRNRSSHVPTAALAILITALLFTGSCSKKALSKEEYFEQGKAYVAAGKLNEATIEFRRALQIDPDYGEAEAELGSAYHELGDHPRASKEYGRAADLLPDNVDVQLRAGTMRLLAHNFLDAKTFAERVIAKDPRNIVALMLRANAMAGMADVEEAVKQIEDAIALDPKRADLYTNLGTIQANGANLAAAEAAFKKGLEIAPTDARPHAAIANFYWASNRIPEAEREYLKAVELDPKDKLANRALASFYTVSGRPQLAERFLRAVAAEGNDIAASFRLSDYLVLFGKTDEGVAILNELAKRPASYAPATTRLAALAYAQGRKDEAHRQIAEVVSRDKIFAPALLVQARFALFEDKPDDAMAKAQAALKADPRLEGAHYLVAQLQQAKGNVGEAITSLKAVLQLNPRAATAQMDLAQLQASAGKIDAAITLADSAIANSKGVLDMRLKLVRLLFAQGDLVRAERELDLLRRQFTPNAPVMAASGGLALLKRDTTSARKYFEQALAIDPNDLDAISGMVGVEILAGRPDAARQRAEAALAKAPKQPQRLMLTARTYSATGDVPRAEDTLKQTINLDPTNTDAYGMLGQLLYQQGKLEDGRKEFEKIAEQQPRNVAALTMVAIIARRQGNTDEAIRRYEQILVIDPEAVLAANNLAFLYVETNQKLDRAIELATMAQKRAPNEAGLADTLGWAYVKKGVPLMGLHFLKVAVEKDPQDPVNQYHLGAAYAALKDAPNAIVHLEQALKISSTFAGADQARSLLQDLKK